MKKIKKYMSVFFVILILVVNINATPPDTGIKNIILFIGDGMGFEHIRAAGMYLNGKPGTLIFESFPYQGEVTTYSANNSTTDSAAAATAMATGKKVNNGTISMAIPGDNSELTTLLEYYSSLGKSTGLVTSTHITHATPAAFAAHEPHRSNFNGIAIDFFTQTRPTLLLGGGGFGTSRELAQTNGYTVVTTKKELEALEPTANLKISGQFGNGNLPYEDNYPENFPTLKEMTEATLTILGKTRKGFFLMVEGGRIDHASHENDILNAVKELIMFNSAVTYAYEWARVRSDTFIIVTADHETGNLEVIKNNGKGNLPVVAWGTIGHTGKNVGVFAYGSRGEEVEGVINNTDIFSILLIPTFNLTVQSTPDSGIDIMVSPADNNGYKNGRTDFTRVYNEGETVTLTAPYLNNSKSFSQWTIDGSVFTGQTIRVTMNRERTVNVYYAHLAPTDMNISRTLLNFGYAIGGSLPSSQSIIITKEGGTPLRWAASSDSPWIHAEPSAGTGPGTINVSVDPTGLVPGNYNGFLRITDLNVINSSLTATINFIVKKYSQDKSPLGYFETPINGSTISSSIAVTGWALDDIGVKSVKIYREPVHDEGDQLIYIGAGFSVEGARPDVEQAFPDYPNNFKAGWGYMMLTNFLPNRNGSFTLHAAVEDINGNIASLGTKTITVDNNNAVKPFGAIDTPKMGEMVSGKSYRNQGWALTPLPNTIPIDGSTMKVLIDGVIIGNLTTNIFREDIAILFPGYSNSNGAHAYFDFDTDFFKNGIHTISWQVTDNAGTSDGVGSRYFEIFNADEVNSRASYDTSISSSFNTGGSREIPDALGIRIPVKYWVGGEETKTGGYTVSPDDQGLINLKVTESQRIVLKLANPNSDIIGYMVVGHQLRPLPIGSTLDKRSGTFYWLPGPGFMGEYRLLFRDLSPGRKIKVHNTNSEINQVIINIKIEPAHISAPS